MENTAHKVVSLSCFVTTMICQLHGYRWLTDKIRLDLGIIYSDNYAQRCCKYAGIRSIYKRCKYTKPGQKIYSSLLMGYLAVNRPFIVVVSDMLALWCNNTYY